ncbi:MAG: c-type cytochrome [Saprospiraceae bacterium]
MMDIKRFTAYLLFLCFFLAAGIASAQDAAPAADLAEGETLFKNNCAACHNKNMKDNLTGPALGGTEERWAAYPREDLYKWINNSQAMINAGHPRAVELWNQWKPTVMSNFNLSDQQIENILAYINDVYTRVPVTAVAPGAGAAGEPQKPNNTLLFLGLFVVLGLVALVLSQILNNLNYLAKVKESGVAPPRKTLVQTLTSKGVIAFVVFALVVLGGYTTVNNAINLGRQQGYQPEQPIKFSHATHAGLHKIDCQYCHDGARRSKHSVIPAANTCMNCHKVIKVGTTYGTAEISKIYASIGFDPNTDKYIENYEDLPQDEIEKIYKKWFTDSYIKEKNTLDAEGEMLVQDQWDGIVNSLTNPDKKKIQGPIEWIRIHNMPDHVYFNHAQHVTVGKLECQTCHGPVEEMEVVQQYSPLSMGWCVNCHRKTEVQFAGNEYYKSYVNYHEEMAAGKRDKVTVEEVGGLECQKCHY